LKYTVVNLDPKYTTTSIVVVVVVVNVSCRATSAVKVVAVADVGESLVMVTTVAEYREVGCTQHSMVVLQRFDASFKENLSLKRASVVGDDGLPFEIEPFKMDLLW